MSILPPLGSGMLKTPKNPFNDKKRLKNNKTIEYLSPFASDDVKSDKQYCAFLSLLENNGNKPPIRLLNQELMSSYLPWIGTKRINSVDNISIHFAKLLNNKDGELQNCVNCPIIGGYWLAGQDITNRTEFLCSNNTVINITLAFAILKGKLHMIAVPLVLKLANPSRNVVACLLPPTDVTIDPIAISNYKELHEAVGKMYLKVKKSIYPMTENENEKFIRVIEIDAEKDNIFHVLGVYFTILCKYQHCVTAKMIVFGYCEAIRMCNKADKFDIHTTIESGSAVVTGSLQMSQTEDLGKSLLPLLDFYNQVTREVEKVEAAEIQAAKEAKKTQQDRKAKRLKTS